jgi:hypothetical protein
MSASTGIRVAPTEQGSTHASTLTAGSGGEWEPEIVALRRHSVTVRDSGGTTTCDVADQNPPFTDRRLCRT